LGTFPPGIRRAAAALLLLVACGGDRGDEKALPADLIAGMAEPASGTYVLGTSITGEGAVAEHAAGDAFIRGGPIFFSIDVTGATTDQQIEVEWIDGDGRVVHYDGRLVRQGSRYAAFSAPSTDGWPPGAYRVSVIINGRRVNEQALMLIQSRSAAAQLPL
jgi:hypothetical protein